MNSIFRILSSEQWDEAKITGLIPRCSADIERNCVHVNEFADLNIVCNRFFEPSENPVALEFAPDTYSRELKWLEPTAEKPWRDGRLSIENLHSDFVLNVYSFKPEQTADGIVYRLQGE